MKISLTLAHWMVLGKSIQIEFSPQQSVIIQDAEQNKTIFSNSRIWNVYYALYWKRLSASISQENESKTKTEL